ncbi:MAG: thiamine diphosphokinase [Lactobacillaceae bacterium]|jgi:thiamine pyrophosphokinase|nr:thiamine diphosphokinase [Lactobacillaceae bacterium]
MKIINVMAGGPSLNLPIGWQQTEGNWIGADHGNITLLNAGITPDIAVGDFDSLSKDEKFSASRIISVDAIKDDTDTELAIRLAGEEKPDQINIFGATGGRLDHEMVNLFFVLRDDFANLLDKIKIIDYKNIINFTDSSRPIDFLEGYKYVSFMNMTAVKNLSILGAKYQLEHFNSAVPRMFSSNEFVNGNPISLEFESGVLMFIYSKD